METAELVLEYLKVILSASVVFLVVITIFILAFKEDIKALFLRIAKITLPGGTEVSTPQSVRASEEDEKPAPQQSNTPVQGLPTDLTPEQQQTTEQLIRSHIATAYLWEYRYLNYFFVRGTQLVLNWIIGLPQPTTFSHYDSHWLPIIPSANERQAIITALECHHLIMQDASGIITVTPKGEEYFEWRGELPPLTNHST